MVQKIPASGLDNAGGNFKNLLINGDYQIWQRATSAATVTASNSAGTYMSDRWASWEYNDGTITQEQSALDNDDFETTGMRNALLVKCTGTDSSIAADQFAMITQVIEAQNCQGLKWGTDNAKDVTLSFGLSLILQELLQPLFVNLIQHIITYQKNTQLVQPILGRKKELLMDQMTLTVVS